MVLSECTVISLPKRRKHSDALHTIYVWSVYLVPAYILKIQTMNETENLRQNSFNNTLQKNNK